MEKPKKDLKLALYRIISKFGIGVFQKSFPEYFAKEPLAPSDRYVEYPFVTRHLPPMPARVLDVGCSGSNFPLILSGLGYDTYAVDLRPYPILNKLSFKNFTFTQADITATKFKDGFFDAVTAISTVEHIGLAGRYGTIEQTDGDHRAVAEMSRIVKRGGRVLLTIPCGRYKIIRPFTKIYDAAAITDLIGALRVEEKLFYWQDAQDDWCACSESQAVHFESKSDRYPLCLLSLQKP